MNMKKIGETIKGLWSLLVGLKVTGLELCKRHITIHYPRSEVTNLGTYRGHIELVPVVNDARAPRCIVCWRCVEICPSRCISIKMHVKGEERSQASDRQELLLGPGVKLPLSQHKPPPPDKIERVLDDFHLDYSLCSLCGLCVQSCPVDSLRFSRDAYLAGMAREEFQLDLLARLKTQAASAVSTPSRAEVA